MPPPSEHQDSQLRQSYDPYEDAQARFPDWRIEIMEREPDAEFFAEAKMVLISRQAFLEDPRHIYAQVVAYLDNAQDDMGEGAMTEEQEARAGWEARTRLGRGPAPRPVA